MIPRRLDRLPWSRWHWLVVIGLGITWILDGFEITLVGSIASALTDKHTLGLTTHQASSAGMFYLAGAVAGALFFGYLTDRVGRKKLFVVTLGVYLLFTVATAFAWNFASFAAFRVLAGSGIGGEYAAINSAIDKLILARVRGLSLMTVQAFLYNAIFFTYTLVLTDFMGVSKTKAGLFLIPFAVGNFLGPLVFGPLLEVRAMAIALFYSVGTGFAILSPTLF